MNVSLQNIDKVSALLTVKLEKADYQEKVDKSLKNFRQKAQIPGFRKGMVPMSLVKKMYGKSVLAEEVNKLLSDSVYKYIQDNKVNILGEPLPNEDKQKAIDFDTMEEFEFLFDIALAPEFKAEVAADDKVDYYTIDVTEEMVDNQVKAYTQRNGKYEKVDAYADNDMLKGLLAELDAEGNTKEGGIQVEGAVMMPAYMKNDDQKAIFANAKVNDVLVFNPYTAWDGNAAELSSLLKVDKEAAAEMKSNFSFQVEEITRFVAGELNQEIFDLNRYYPEFYQYQKPLISSLILLLLLYSFFGLYTPKRYQRGSKELVNLVKANLPVQKGGHRHLIGRVKYGRSAASRL